jgi:hypothetical protein
LGDRLLTLSHPDDRVPDFKPKAVASHEENISAKQPEAQEKPRIPGQNGDPFRTEGNQGAARQGETGSLCLIR